MADKLIERIKAGDMVSPEVLKSAVVDLVAENERLRDSLVKCREEIDGYIRQEYPGDHPVQERYRQRDFTSNPARAALEGQSND